MCEYGNRSWGGNDSNFSSQRNTRHFQSLSQVVSRRYSKWRFRNQTSLQYPHLASMKKMLGQTVDTIRQSSYKQNKIFKSNYKSSIIILQLHYNVPPFIVIVMYNYRIAYFVEVFYINWHKIKLNNYCHFSTYLHFTISRITNPIVICSKLKYYIYSLPFHTKVLKKLFFSEY